MIRKTINIILTVMILSSSNLYAKSSPVLTFGTGTFPPNSYIDPDTGKCIGHTIDAVNKILSGYDFELNAICTSANRIYRMIENGDIDLTLNTASPKHLEGLVTVVTPPYRYIKITLFENPEIEKNIIVSAVRGFEYDGHRKLLKNEGFVFTDLGNTKASLLFFLKGRSSYLLSYKEPIEHALKDKNITLPPTIIEKDIGAIPTHFAITNKSAIFGDINNALKDYVKRNKLTVFMEDPK